MAETPKSIKVEVDWSRPELQRALEDARMMGKEEGLLEGRREILDWLQKAYVEDEGRPDRGSPKAEAILEIVRDASQYLMRGKKGKR